MKLIQTPVGPLYQAPSLGALSWIVHGFGTKNVSLSDYLAALDCKNTVVAKTKQVHGRKVHVLKEVIPSLLEGDAFISASPGVACFVRTADCVPLLLCDPVGGVVAAVHAGWRGLMAEVVESAITEMKNQFGTRPGDLMAAVGPSICEKCYAVGEEVIALFGKKGLDHGFWNYKAQDKTFSLNLAAIAAQLLGEAGVGIDRISFLHPCTSCSSDFVSYRRDRAEKSRQVNFIIIK